MSEFDFGGWATRNNLKCSDGRTIREGAFKHCDGRKVPLVWQHGHNDIHNILGYAVLAHRDGGLYANCKFNDTESGQAAKLVVEHGDVCSLSICAGQLKQNGKDVMHGEIKEVSLVVSGANPGALIDTIIRHGEAVDDEAIIYTGQFLDMIHSEELDDPEPIEEPTPSTTEEVEIATEPVIEEGEPMPESTLEHADSGKTIADVIATMNDEQKNVMYALIGEALSDETITHTEGGTEMKINVFDKADGACEDVLTHADQTKILTMAKNSTYGTLQNALGAFIEDNSDTLKHGFDDIEYLFPEFKDLRPGAPELINNDLGWVNTVMRKAHKSPMSRIRTRQMDARQPGITAKGYVTGDQKTNMGNLKLIKRTTDPQTIYVKDSLNRDDIVDITEFDVVNYTYGVMKNALQEKLALAIMLGDGLDEGDDDKIEETHIRPIWTDDNLYTNHVDVDIAAAKAELQGTGTGNSFGENFIYAEALIAAALYAREGYRGTGTPDFYCDPHVLNVMLLARDMNGRRIYASKAELATALNVGDIYTAEQFAGKTRVTGDGANAKTKQLLGLMVNMADYNIGATKGGEITSFKQFDIDFNQEKMLIETRLSGALTRIKSAIALELVLTPPADPDDVDDTNDSSPTDSTQSPVG